MFSTTLGCDLPGKPNPADRPSVPADVMSFDVLYRANCAGCHGADGKLGPAPALNDPIFLAIVPDGVLIDTIAKGRPGTPMPAFSEKANGALTDAQVLALANGIRESWQGTSTSTSASAPSLPRYATDDDDSGATSGDRERGANVFATACANCHGKDGLGNAENGAFVM